MKNPKFFTLAVFAAFLLLVSCKQSTKEKKLSPNLTAFSFKTDDGKNLIGVKDIKRNDTVISPIEASLIVADKHVILITDKHERKHAYTIEGIKLGSFDNWIHWITEDVDYYHGTNYNKNCYYFPQKRSVFKATSSYSASNALLLERSTCWQVIDFQGNTLSTLKKPFQIVKSLQKKDGEKLFIVSPKGNAYTIAHIDGSAPKRVSKLAWRKIEKSFINLQKKSNGVIYAETDQI